MRRRTSAVRSQVDAAFGRVVDDGRFVVGPSLEAFEQEFAAYCGVEYAVGVGSGTDALELALRAFGIGHGDEVITAANTCVPTVAAITCAGATPVLADVDPATRTLDPGAAAEAVTERTRAIIPVHLYGQCADMPSLMSLAAERSLIVIEDAAQAHGVEHGGMRAGSLGDAAAFSFYPTKNLGALGDGGAVVTRTQDIAARVRRLRSYGELSRYESIEEGRNSRLDDLQAEILRTQLPHLDGWNRRRRELASRYRDALADTGLRLPQDLGLGRHVYHLFVVETDDRVSFRRDLSAAGIGTLVHYPRAIHQHPAYCSLGSGVSLEVSERLAAQVVSLPLYAELTDDEADAVIAAVKDVVER